MAQTVLRYDVELRSALEAVAALGGLIAIWKDADPALAHALPRELREHRQPRCVAVKDGGALARCRHQDELPDGFWRARGDRPWLRSCHAGVRELLVPLRVDGVFLGTCFVGNQGAPDHLDEPRAAAAARLLQGAIAALAPLRAAWLQVHPDRLAAHPAIARAVALIEAEPRADLRAAALAREVGLSASRFVHAFAEVVGMSFSDFRQRRVLWRARRALAASDEPIAEIAWRLGWRNPNYFATAFRRELGCSPSAYRRAVRAEGVGES